MSGASAPSSRSEWDILAFRMQFLKQTATADELITWLSRRMIDIPYVYKRAWENEPNYQRQYRIMLAVQDTVKNFWRPQLSKWRHKVWKQLSREERAQITALREAWRQFVQENQAEVDQYLYRTYRNQVPYRSAWYGSLYDLIRKDYPSYRLMQLRIRRPADLTRSELQDLSRSIYNALGKQKEDLLRLEKALFKALAPCEYLWLSPYSWYWRGQDEEMLRALNLMIGE
ncbi:MAG: hypothetical protein IT261_07930 [Saprospiraceae bacterium]|nr:hypothetical protein [Saprospiraceae bacterium]